MFEFKRGLWSCCWASKVDVTLSSGANVQTNQLSAMNKQTFPHLLLPDILLGFKNNIIWNDTEQLLLTYQALPKRPAEQSLEQDLEGGGGSRQPHSHETLFQCHILKIAQLNMIYYPAKPHVLKVNTFMWLSLFYCQPKNFCYNPKI